MPRAATYHIEDEPQPGALQHLSVDPLWPLFAVMLAGGWLAFPWSALNAFAVGSPTRRRELALAVAGLAGSGALGVLLLEVAARGWLTAAAAPYVGLILTLWKLGLAYALFFVQQRTIHLYQYFGGALRNGLPVLLAGAFFGRPAVMRLMDNVLWRMTIG